MNLSPLQKKLLPSISTLPATEVAVALFPLSENFVTNHLVPHERFKERILQRVLANHGVDLEEHTASFEKEHALQTITGAPLKTLIRSLGLSWNADAVARMALGPKDDSNNLLTRFTHDDMRFALKFRGRGSADDDADDNVPADEGAIINDGMRCFAAWTSDIPDDVRRLLKYQCEAQDMAWPEIRFMAPAAVTSYAAFCVDWCEHRMAIKTETDDQESEKEADSGDSE